MYDKIMCEIRESLSLNYNNCSSLWIVAGSTAVDCHPTE